ncbi:kinase-like domain-containing protein [Mycena crocata]|nr:kinase-like domain-containing protein [Mycena crocata]
MERLDKLFHGESTSYAKFLSCRGTTAQRLLDLLQDLLDYDLEIIKRRRLFKALIRLSGDSKLHPRCFTLTDLQLGEQVAGGAFGDIYKGTLCGQRVGIKLMRVFGEKDVDELLKEFGREALIWRQLSHPNLLPFFGLYSVQKRLCLVSPWMENGDIVAFLKKERYSIDRVLSFILDVALGLQHLHEKDVVHGDLKPANILVTPSRRACITDFGLSSIVAATSSFQYTHSSTRARGGTVRYQAPELLRGGHNHLGSDIYAFACVAYELSTRTIPFSELRMDSAIIVPVLEGTRPSRPSSFSAAAAYDGLWDLIERCWMQQTELRPTASQIVEILTGPHIQATATPSSIDWDETSTSRFRRALQAPFPLPSISEMESMISGEGSSVQNINRLRDFYRVPTAADGANVGAVYITTSESQERELPAVMLTLHSLTVDAPSDSGNHGSDNALSVETGAIESDVSRDTVIAIGLQSYPDLSIEDDKQSDFLETGSIPSLSPPGSAASAPDSTDGLGLSIPSQEGPSAQTGANQSDEDHNTVGDNLKKSDRSVSPFPDPNPTLASPSPETNVFEDIGNAAAPITTGVSGFHATVMDVLGRNAATASNDLEVRLNPRHPDATPGIPANKIVADVVGNAVAATTHELGVAIAPMMNEVGRFPAAVTNIFGTALWGWGTQRPQS